MMQPVRKMNQKNHGYHSLTHAKGVVILVAFENKRLLVTVSLHKP